ncbi:hypothetical protein ACLOJK_016279 [Asimina triloba]
MLGPDKRRRYVLAEISLVVRLLSQKRISDSVGVSKGHGTLQVKLEHLSKEKASAPTSFDVPVPFEIQGNPTFKVKVVREEDSIGKEAAEAAYEAGDEHDETLSMRRDHSDCDLQARAGIDGSGIDLSMKRNDISYDSFDADVNGRSGRDHDALEMLQNGHVSDPGMGRREFWGSPALKRSCSNIESRDVLKKVGNQRSLSLRDPAHFSESLNVGGGVQGIQTSPMSIKTSCSADRVMLRRRSSSQVLPSRSRRLWWKLFLWSHRNLHKPPPEKSKLLSAEAPSNKKTGYSSDTLEPRQAQVERKNKGKEVSSWGLPGRFSAEAQSSQHGRVSSLWPQNQWVAFWTDSSPISRVDEWITNSLEINPVLTLDDQDSRGEIKEDIDYPPSPDANGSSGKALNAEHLRLNSNLSDEVLQANNIIQSLNSFSTVAHISGMALKVVPNISPFANLRCTLIKELYLAGNKMSDVEGLHRLLKLAVLDLSFNKITTTKALGQLVANYNSLLALNLVGNPILANIGEDQLRKAVSSFLPHLAFLNKQPIGQRRAREVAVDSSIAKAALGSGGRSARRKVTKRPLQASSSSRSRGAESIGAHRSSHNKSKSRHRS